MRKLIVFLMLTLPFAAFAENEPKTAKDSELSKTIFTGKVTNMENYQPLSGVQIELSSKDFKKTIQTDANGRFTFEQLPEGEYNVVIKRAGFETVKRTQTLTEGQKLNLGFMLLQD